MNQFIAQNTTGGIIAIQAENFVSCVWKSTKIGLKHTNFMFAKSLNRFLYFVDDSNVIDLKNDLKEDHVNFERRNDSSLNVKKSDEEKFDLNVYYVQIGIEVIVRQLYRSLHSISCDS